MLIQGTSQAQIKKVSYLESFGLSSDQAHSLKRKQEIKVRNALADTLLQNGLASVVEVDDEPEVEEPVATSFEPFEPEITEEPNQDKDEH